MLVGAVVIFQQLRILAESGAVGVHRLIIDVDHFMLLFPQSRKGHIGVNFVFLIRADLRNRLTALPIGDSPAGEVIVPAGQRRHGNLCALNVMVVGFGGHSRQRGIVRLAVVKLCREEGDASVHVIAGYFVVTPISLMGKRIGMIVQLIPLNLIPISRFMELPAAFLVGVEGIGFQFPDGTFEGITGRIRITSLPKVGFRNQLAINVPATIAISGGVQSGADFSFVERSNAFPEEVTVSK